MRNRLLDQSHFIVTKLINSYNVQVDKANVYQKGHIMSVKSKNKKNKGFKGALNLLPGETLATKNGIKWVRKASK